MRFSALSTTVAVGFGAISCVCAQDQTPLGGSPGQRDADGRPKNRPNIVVLLTDDQDLHMDSLDYMPLLRKYVAERGTTFARHYCTTAICCPSRVSLWTGRNAHNTNVTDVMPPWGGYPKFVSQGFNEAYLPVWLQDAGYSTYYTGKLMNHHNVDNWNDPRPAGWTSSDFLLDPWTYEYLNATFQRNNDPPISHEGQYSTDLIAEKAFGLLDEGVASGKPFFLTVAPIAPHSNVGGTREPGRILMTAPIPAKRHEHLFPHARVPRSKNFNPVSPSGASWIKKLTLLSEDKIEYHDAFYRARLQSLQAVDELIEGLFARLDKHGITENTYVIYSTDNGYHIGQHRLPPGKECGFEEDIHIPLIVRGPGVLEGGVSDAVTAHTDLVPTILKIAQGDFARSDFDGSPIPLLAADLDGGKEGEARQEHVNVEYWGRSLPEGIWGFSLDDGKEVFYGANNTYKALRLISTSYNIYYAVWCTGEHELYDMSIDPSQTDNLYPSAPAPAPLNASTPPSDPSPDIQHHAPKISGHSIDKLLPRLDALLMVTKSCKGTSCIKPWSVIHPQGNVHTLGDALRAEFDAFYAGASRRKVGFERCEDGYILDSEGAQEVAVFAPRSWLGGVWDWSWMRKWAGWSGGWGGNGGDEL